MKRECGERGEYAADMLETAAHMLEKPAPYPRQAEMAAYCIRQAAVEVFGGSVDRVPLGVLSKRVVNAKQNLPAEDHPDYKEFLKDLLSSIDKMRDFFNTSNIHQTRLAERIRSKSGLAPLSGNHSLMEYAHLISELNDHVHRVRGKRGSLDDVRKYYQMATTTLARLFLPMVRMREIDKFAEMSAPQPNDVIGLKEILTNHFDFDCFASRMRSADWLDLMDDDMLKSPSGDSPWPLGSVAYYLKNEHFDSFMSMIDNNFDRWVKDDAGLVELGYVGFKLGDRGVPLLVRALNVDNSVPQLCDYALVACMVAKPSIYTLELVRSLLDTNSGLNDVHRTIPVSEGLVKIMDWQCSITVINMLVHELAYGYDSECPPSIPRLDLVVEDPRHISSEIGLLARSLCSALMKADYLGISTSKLVGALDDLPGNVKPRFVAWLYSVMGDIDCSLMANFLLDGCRNRPPTDEDGLLLDRLWRHCDATDVAAQLLVLIGEAPESKRLTEQPLWKLERGDRWRIAWAHIVHHKVKLVGWETCLDLTSGFVKIGRNNLHDGAPSALSCTDSPAEIEDGPMDPLAVAAKIASQKPSDETLLHNIDPYGSPPDLIKIIRPNAHAWAENPVQIIKTLRHPTYVAGYFRSLAAAEDRLDAQADRIVDAICLACTRPWEAATAYSFPPYGDVWKGAESAGLILIERMIYKNVQLSKDALSRIWDVVLKAVSDRPAEPPAGSSDYLGAAFSKPHTRALQTMIVLTEYAKSKDMEVPDTVLEVLTGSLSRTGQDGAEHRVILGMYASLLHTALPDWFLQNEGNLFRSEVPGDLGSVAFEMYLMWVPQDAFILEKYRSMVLDFVKKDSWTAMDRLLLGMFWGIDGYDHISLTKKLVDFGPKYVSLAGARSACLLRQSADTDYIQRGVDFWDHVLKSSPDPETVAGFGAWADVAELDQSRWESLTLRTCKMASGKLDWTWRVSRRIRSSKTITNVGLQIMKLIVQGDQGGRNRYKVRADASSTLNKSKNDMDVRESWSVLRDEVMQHGHHGLRHL